jgi:diguanylate cyclase (GGDEF)-like protein
MAAGLRRGRPVGAPPWRTFVLAGAVACVLFALSTDRWLQGTLLVGTYAVSTLLLARTAWRTRWRTPPDQLLPVFLVGAVLYLVALAGRSFWPLTVGPLPAPSLVDVLFFSSYACFGTFLLLLGRRYRNEDLRALLDAVIIVLGLTPVGWVALIEPQIEGRFTASNLTFSAYPVALAVLLALAIRVAFVADRLSGPYLLLGGWIAGELVADLVYAHMGVSGSFRHGQSWQALWLVSATCIGALALRPDLPDVGAPHSARQTTARGRLWALAVALALPVLTLGYAELANLGRRTVLFSAATALVLIVLACLRLSGLMVDLAAQRRVQRELEGLAVSLAHQSLHDPLTALGNRALFRQRIEHALEQRTTAAGRSAAVLLLDLDDFKAVNDTLGHDAGDKVLVEVARRLEQVTRDGESVARLGGDEFAVVMQQASLSDSLRLAARVQAALDVPYELGPRSVRPHGSIGISLALRGQDRSTLLAEADIAMYAAKVRGATTSAVFDPVLHGEVLERHQLESDLRQSVQRGELRLVYQPLVHLATNDMVGVEALVRWEHPTRGTLFPQAFIPLAEVNGAILRIGDWVLEQTCRQALAWDEALPGRQLRVTVNVSPRQLSDPDFVGRTADILRQTPLDPARLTLEITESALGSDTETVIGRLRQLKELGVSLAIDDFGTGYSSLSHLRRLPVDVLKIDKSFVTGIAREPAEWALTTAIVRLAVSLGKTTLAEGIETGGQLAHLRSLNVELGQGYLFAGPVPPDRIAALARASDGQAFLFD